MSDLVLNVEVREHTGTGGARATRRAGLVPGVLYGGPQGAVAISLNKLELAKGLNRGGFLSQVVNISHKGDSQAVLVRDIQFHPVTSVPLHIDLYRVDADQIITIEVPVEFINSEISVGLKRGGALNVVRHTVELSCPASKIPENLVFDLAAVDINDSVHISSIELPDGVTPTITDRDFTIATIVGKGGAADDADDAADEAEAGGDGEGGDAQAKED